MENKIPGLVLAAIRARRFSYAPYSHFAVGAALLAKDGRIFTGCNVENASYSVTNCAERTALYKAISEGANGFEAIAIVGGAAPLQDIELPVCTPCGVCCQALHEFCAAECRVILVQSETVYTTYTLGQLLPMGFGSQGAL